MNNIIKITAASVVAAGALYAGSVFAGPNTAPTLTQVVATQNVAQTSIVSGTFDGRSDHVTSGGARIVKTAKGYDLVLDADFYLDGAPAPVIGFGNNGTYDVSSQFTKLNRKRGGQTYHLPADFTPANYSEVYVWCEDFAVPLGVATLTAA